MPPTKILHLRSGTRLFGPERVILSLARYSSPDFTHIVGGVECGQPGLLLAEAKADGLQTFRLEPRGRLDLGAVKRLAEFIRAEGVDLIHAHDFRADFYALAARRRTRVAAVTTLHGPKLGSLMRYPGQPWVTAMATSHLWHQGNLRTAAYEVLDTLQVRLFDRVLAVSPAIAAEARRWRIPAHKLRVVLNGVDTERFAPVPPRLMRERVVVGSVGRLVRQKGYELFLQMAATIAKEMSNVDFLLVGEGHLRVELERESERLGLGDRVTFAGQRDPVESSYAEMDIFVSSSLSEGLPIVVLEAMASQVPVVATRVGATADVIEDGASGLLVEPGDARALAEATLRLMRSPEEARAMAEAGHQRVVEHFSAQAMARRTEAVYRELLDGPK